MDDLLLKRLEQAAENLLQKNLVLAETCQRLETEKTQWSEERKLLLGKVEGILTQLDEHLGQEDS
jgi:FtsZ-binding cell division protein ZapB